MTELTLEKPLTDASWDDYARGCPGACAFHSSEWKRAVSATFPQYRGDDHLLQAGDRTVGAWSGFLFAPLPFVSLAEASTWNLYGGYLGEDEAADADTYLGGLLAWEIHARRRHMCAISVTPTPRQSETVHRLLVGAGFRIETTKTTHVLDVPDDANALWEGYKGSVRTDVRRAEKSGVVVDSATDAASINEFYGIYIAAMRRFRSLAKPHSLVQCLVDGPIARLLVARLGSRVIGGLLYLQFAGNVTIWMAASSPDDRRYSPNHLLYHAVLTEATELGCRQVDFGASPPENDGLMRFKESFGATSAEFGTFHKVLGRARLAAWRASLPIAKTMYQAAQTARVRIRRSRRPAD